MTRVGGLGDPQAGFAFHDYCLPASGSGCVSEATAMTNAVRHVTRTREALLLTGFGSNPFPHDLTGMVRRADRQMVPWIEWAYCPCSDPTGATPDPLVLNPAQPPSGANLGQLALRTLVEPYPQVIAGSPARLRRPCLGHRDRLLAARRRAGPRRLSGRGSDHGHGHGIRFEPRLVPHEPAATRV